MEVSLRLLLLARLPRIEQILHSSYTFSDWSILQYRNLRLFTMGAEYGASGKGTNVSSCSNMRHGTCDMDPGLTTLDTFTEPGFRHDLITYLLTRKSV